MSQIIHYFNLAVMVLKYGWPFFLLTALVIAHFKWKNWPVDCVIIERRGENLIRTNDRAGRYDDAFTGLVGYKLLKSKDTIPSVNFDWILHNAVKHTNLLERLVNIIRPTQGTIFLYKYGTKQYKPVNISENDDAMQTLEEEKDLNGQPVFVYRYDQYDPRGTLDCLNFEVVDWDNMNFMVQEMRASFERRKKKGEWMKTILVPLMIIACSVVIGIIMMKFSMDWAKEVPRPPAPIQSTDPNPNIPIVSDVIPGK